DRDVKLKVAPEPRPVSTDSGDGTRAKGRSRKLATAEPKANYGPRDDTASPGDAGTSAQQTSFIENDSLPKLITVVGDFASIEVGQQLWVQGDWMEHPAHGRQFRADRWKV